MVKCGFFLFLVLLSGCLAQRSTMWPQEWEQSFTYFEQRSRGLNRSPLELMHDNPSIAMANFTNWLSNNRIHRNNQAVTYQDPQMVASRRTRWPLIHDAIRNGHITTSRNGLLRPSEDVIDPELSTLQTLVREENLDRAQCLSILLDRAQVPLGSRRAEELSRSSAQIWARLDQAAGAVLWDINSSPSNSENADTTSILKPGPRRTQDL